MYCFFCWLSVRASAAATESEGAKAKKVPHPTAKTTILSLKKNKELSVLRNKDIYESR